MRIRDWSSDVCSSYLTDSIAVEGLDKAIERAQMYAAAGADMIFPDAVRGEDQIQRFVDEVPAALTINLGLGIRSRATTRSEERRGGKECYSNGRSRRPPYH